MNKKAVGVVVLVALIAVAGGLYWLYQGPEPEPESRVAVLPPPRPLPAPTPAVAPEMKEPIALVQPKILYRYADPALESRSSGQKMMIRMGHENAARLKAKLREVRALVARLPPEG